MKTYRLIACALLAALAFILQISNGILGFPSGFGMTIDLAAVPILLALFIFGAEYAILTLAVLTLIILTTSATGYIGALMKLAATLPMIIVPYFMTREKTPWKEVADAFLVIVGVLALFAISVEFAKMPGLEMLAGIIPLLVVIGAGYWIGKQGGKVDLSDVKLAGLALLVAALARSTLMTFANLYFAGPVFYHMSPNEFIALLNAVFLPVLGSKMGWFVIFFWNFVQSIVEFTIAWIPAYYFGFAKRHSE
jgi:riboflavin transporter FmnP